MSTFNIILFIALVLVGLRAVWAGIRGLRGEIGVRYGWPFNSLVSKLSSEEQNQTDQIVLRLGSGARLVFDLVLMGIGGYALWMTLVQ